MKHRRGHSILPLTTLAVATVSVASAATERIKVLIADVQKDHHRTTTTPRLKSSREDTLAVLLLTPPAASGAAQPGVDLPRSVAEL
jgi:hypothetical protein